MACIGRHSAVLDFCAGLHSAQSNLNVRAVMLLAQVQRERRSVGRDVRGDFDQYFGPRKICSNGKKRLGVFLAIWFGGVLLLSLF